jgi:AcrR family transcriptional regulator
MGKLKYHHGDLKHAILEASLELIAQHGLEGLTLRAVAQRLGVSHAAPVYHFATRADLIGALAERGFVGFSKALDAAFQGEVKGRLLRVGRAYLEFALANPSLYRIIFGSELSSASTLSAELTQASQRALDFLAQAAGPHAILCWAVVHGLVGLRAGPYLCRTEAERKALDSELEGALATFVDLVEG